MLKTEQDFLDILSQRMVLKGLSKRARNMILGNIKTGWDRVCYPKIYSYPGTLSIMDLETGKDFHGQADNWIWDRPTGLFLMNLKRGSHDFILRNLYLIHSNALDQPNSEILDPNRDDSGAYIRDGYGFCLSSISTYPTKGIGIPLSDQEMSVFKDQKFTEI